MNGSTVAGATVASSIAASGLPRSEALRLLAHVSGRSRERLIAGSRDPLSPDVVSAFEAVAMRRAAGEPIAYLIGRRDFYGRSFAVDARVLIPRPETELLVDEALRAVDRLDGETGRRVLDLGTGSGAIAITLALERPSLDVVASDASPGALELATANATRLDARVRFVRGDWYGAVTAEPPFDVVVSNPPYVAAGDPHLAVGDLRFEPPVALTDDADGLAHLRRIVSGAPMHLTAAGVLIVEHGHDQGAAVRRLFASAGLVDVTTLRDLAGHERTTSGRKRALGVAPMSPDAR